MPNDDWYTPEDIVELSREALGGRIELDPASSEEANARVRAERYYDGWAMGVPLSGLDAAWDCETFFMNCPFSSPGRWFTKAAAGWECGIIGAGVVLIADRALCTVAGGRLLSAARMGVVPARRIRFLEPGGKVGKSPSFGVLLVAGGRALDVPRALDRFSRIGTTWLRV